MGDVKRFYSYKDLAPTSTVPYDSINCTRPSETSASQTTCTYVVCRRVGGVGEAVRTPGLHEA
eukprot:2023-Eustigmatos_ZCMA.PRE.1